MGIFDKMKSLVGVGAPTLTLDVDPSELMSGRPVNGTILIAIQERAAPIDTITITLVCDREVAQPDGVVSSQRTQLSETTMSLNGRVMAPGEKRRLDFELPACDLEADAGETYRLLAVAETPGLDPRTSISLARVEPVAAADRAVIDPLDPAGLLAIRSGFVSKLAELTCDGEEIVLIPRFREESYAPGQTFDDRVIDRELVESLRGRVVFLTTTWGSCNFGVLVPKRETGDATVVTITRTAFGMSYASVGDIRSISLARFVSPEEEGISHATLLTDQEDEAQHTGRLFDPELYRQQVRELRQQYPDAT